jgi:hypothetical protein
MSDVSNVTTGKPRIGGAVYRAPKGTPLPISVREALNPAFVSMGYISEDGVTNSNAIESSDQKAWGGDTVLTLQTGKTDTFQMKFLETKNVNVLKAVYGADNVSGNLETGLVVRANSQEAEAGAWIIDMILRDNSAKRIVIPEGKITALGDIAYTDGEATGYDATITAMPYSGFEGDTHRELLQNIDEITSPSLAAMAGTDSIYNTLVSTLQADVAIADNAIEGTLYKQTSGDIIAVDGVGHYIALKVTNNDYDVTSVKVGVSPSATEPVEVDANGQAAVKVTNPESQSVVIISSDGIRTKRDYYSLADVELED